MLDKFNFMIVTFLSILVTSLGTLTFVASTDFNYLLIGGFMIGAGSAVGFLSVAKITTRSSFPTKYHSLMLSFSFTFGLLGAVFGITPMKLLFIHFGYLDFGQITIRFGDKIRPNYKKLALSKYWYVVDILINTTMKICKSYILGFNSLGESYIIFFQNVRMQL